jgi:hypothetical protein
MDKLVKESEYFLAWLVFWLYATFGGGLIVVVCGGILGAILGGAGVDLNSIPWICGGMGFLLGMVLSYVFFRLFVESMIVRKAEMRARETVQQLLSQAGAFNATRLPPTQP